VSQTPAVSGKQLVKILEGQGWYVKRVRGSHHILRHPTIPDAIPVPVHGNQPIKKGTLGSILRTAGISREDSIGWPDACEEPLRRKDLRSRGCGTQGGGVSFGDVRAGTHAESPGGARNGMRPREMSPISSA
jgi:predicted RNA binding protein YcfA (HicA-like mRNA interferase family)